MHLLLRYESEQRTGLPANMRRSNAFIALILVDINKVVDRPASNSGWLVPSIQGSVRGFPLTVLHWESVYS